jgi:hypothetical protein
MANAEMVSSQSGSRPGVTKIAVLLVSKGNTFPLPKTRLSRLVTVAFGQQNISEKLRKAVENNDSIDHVYPRAMYLGKELCNFTGLLYFTNASSL